MLMKELEGYSFELVRACQSFTATFVPVDGAGVRYQSHGSFCRDLSLDCPFISLPVPRK